MRTSRSHDKDKSKACGMLVSYNVTVGGNRTSVRLESEMGDGLQEINYQEGANLYQICTSIDI